MRTSIFILVGICFIKNLFGQPVLNDPNEEKLGYVYNKEISFGGGLHTNGYHLHFEKGSIRKYYLSRFWQIEFNTLRHPKEIKKTVDSSPFNSSRSFVFGKEHSFFALNFGIGEKRYFSEKVKHKGVAVGMTYTLGGSLGFLRPYYIDVPAPDNPDKTLSIRYSDETAVLFLNPYGILGASGLSYGWNDLKLAPGGFAKIGLLFDLGAFDEFMKSIEVGLRADVYLRNLPLMVTNQNRPFFFNLYCTLAIGKRS